MSSSDTHPEDRSTLVPTTLETERLILRLFEEADAEVAERLLNDKEIAANTRSIDYPYPVGDALKWIKRHKIKWESGDAFVFAIHLVESDELVGAMGLEVNKPDHSAELGYWLGRDYWNQGFCTEAARRVVAFGFDSIGLHRITSEHMTRNPASGRVLEKIRMKKEGTLRGHIRKWGVFEDVIIYGMLSSDPRE